MSEEKTKQADTVKKKDSRRKTPVTVCWFRRDLRLEDNHALWQALRTGRSVLPIFIFDAEILGALKEKEDRRVTFIFSAIEAINCRLREHHHSAILCLHGKPVEIFEKLLEDYMRCFQKQTNNRLTSFKITTVQLQIEWFLIQNLILTLKPSKRKHQIMAKLILPPLNELRLKMLMLSIWTH